MSEAGRATRLTEGADEAPFAFFVDGQPVQACAGETIGVALLVAGQRTIRQTAKRDDGRGLYCVMGVCWECAVLLGGRTVRACLEPATPGLHVETLRGRRS
jgi:aerobic-type carbon monoxide dehydrogenase small subunit (CoxS/CutS family)